jgi:N-acetylneuraminic acid mutarotase
MRTTIKSLSSFSLALLICAWISARAQSATWQTVSNEPPCTARHEAALTALDGKLYLLGGRGIKPVEEYDPQANSWKKLAPTPMEFHHFQALAVDGRILVFGAMSGGYPKETPVANLWWFNPKMNEWTKGAEIPEGRRRGGAGAVLDGDKLYLVCGITNGHWNGFVSWVDVFDINSGQWTVLPNAPRPRDHFQAALVDGKIVLAGGRTTYGEINKVFDLTVPEVDVFDIATRRWTTLSNNIPTQRAGCLAVVRDGKVSILGGESMKQPNAHSEAEALSLATGQWESLPVLNRGRHGTGAAFIGDTLYVAAGCGKRGGNPELNSMEKVHWPSLRKTE